MTEQVISELASAGKGLSMIFAFLLYGSLWLWSMQNYPDTFAVIFVRLNILCFIVFFIWCWTR